MNEGAFKNKSGPKKSDDDRESIRGVWQAPYVVAIMNQFKSAWQSLNIPASIIISTRP